MKNAYFKFYEIILTIACPVLVATVQFGDKSKGSKFSLQMSFIEWLSSTFKRSIYTEILRESAVGQVKSQRFFHLIHQRHIWNRPLKGALGIDMVTRIL